MRQVFIQQKLEELGISLNDIQLGDFDFIGEFTAKKTRAQNSPLYKSVGCFFRPNYERGILIYSLIRKFNLQSYLEIGFGRGFSAVCAAKALYDIGSPGVVHTVDPMMDEEHLKMLSQVFPAEWLQKIRYHKGPSEQVVPQMLSNEIGIPVKYDFVYIDGDHRAPAVQKDWDMLKDSWNAFCLFDDYHLPTKKEADIDCAAVIDSIDYENENCEPPEVILMDRRIFIDDRKLSDHQIDYGQCLFTRKNATKIEW